MNTTTTQHHPIFARVYAFMSRFGRELLEGYRHDLMDGTSGRVLELGAGKGDSFVHYPTAVREVVAIEPEPYLRKLALAAAGSAPVPISVQDGVGEDLKFADCSFDAVVVSLVLCSVADPARTLAELYRVTKPNGELRFLEHVRSGTPGMALVQRTLDRTRIWPFLAGGCHCARDTITQIELLFTIERVREVSATRQWAPVTPVVVGVARRAGPARPTQR